MSEANRFTLLSTPLTQDHRLKGGNPNSPQFVRKIKNKVSEANWFTLL